MTNVKEGTAGSGASDRIEALAALAGGFAHDFNNMLTVIRGAAELAERLPPADAAVQLRAIAETADRAAGLTQQLLAFARRQPLRAVPTDLAGLLSALRDEIVADGDTSLRIRVLLPADLSPVLIDREGLMATLRAAAQNACDAMPGGGVLTFAATRVEEASRSLIRLSIADSGSGMAPDVITRAFEPFFTTKPVGAGSGLGLAQLHGFVTQSGGRAEIESAPGRGTTLALFLPVADEGAVDVPAAPAALEVGTRVLLVEDSNTVAAFAEALLRDMGCQVTRAACAAEALGCLAEPGVDFEIMFSDIVMPGMSGIDLAAKVRQERPGLPILLATGHSEQAAREGSDFPILPKPYRREALARMMGSAMMAG